MEQLNSTIDDIKQLLERLEALSIDLQSQLYAHPNKDMLVILLQQLEIQIQKVQQELLRNQKQLFMLLNPPNQIPFISRFSLRNLAVEQATEMIENVLFQIICSHDDPRVKKMAEKIIKILIDELEVQELHNMLESKLVFENEVYRALYFLNKDEVMHAASSAD